MNLLLPKKWHHGHSTLVGIVAGVTLVSYRGWLIFAAGVLAGAVLVVLAAGGYRLGRTLLDGFEVWKSSSRAKKETIRSTPAPVYSMRRQRPTTTDEGEVPY